MDFARVAGRSATMIAAVCLVTACLPGDGGDSSSTSGSQEAKGGQELSQEQARAALPRAEQLPSEVSIDPKETDSSDNDPEATAYPATCLDVQLDGERGAALADEHRTAKVTQGYQGEYGGVLSVSISSHDTPVPAELFDDAGAAQATCAEYTKIDSAGTTKWKLEPSTVPPMGERTYAVGLEMLEGDQTFVGGKVHLSAVSIGHNLVYIVYSAGPASQLSTQTVEELAATTVKNLEKQ